MQKRNLRMTRAVLCLALLCSTGFGSQTSDLKVSEVDPLFATLVKPTEPGFAVLIRHGGRNVYSRTGGVRDLRSKAGIDARTNFRLASFTKQFTAMAIMLLAHDG